MVCCSDWVNNNPRVILTDQEEEGHLQWRIEWCVFRPSIARWHWWYHFIRQFQDVLVGGSSFCDPSREVSIDRQHHLHVALQGVTSDVRLGQRLLGGVNVRLGDANGLFHTMLYSIAGGGRVCLEGCVWREVFRGRCLEG